MKFVLIVLILTGKPLGAGHGAPNLAHTFEFTTLADCQKALGEFRAAMNPKWSYPDRWHACVEMPR